MLDSLAQEMRQNPLLVASLIMFGIYIFVGAAAPVLAPYDPNIQNLRATLAPPTSLNLLGADEYGRDLLSRLIYGTRSSMIVGAAVVACSALIGMVFGILSGYRGGFLDDLIMRSSDVMMAFPFLVLALGLIAGARRRARQHDHRADGRFRPDLRPHRARLRSPDPPGGLCRCRADHGA